MTGFAVPDLVELEQGDSMTRLPQQHRRGEPVIPPPTIATSTVRSDERDVSPAGEVAAQSALVFMSLSRAESAPGRRREGENLCEVLLQRAKVIERRK